jgi:DNA (cytosine-5)-methyltransferase 1
VRSDLETMGYAVGAMPIQAASAGADHLRDRYWFVADGNPAGPQGRPILPERTGERVAGEDSLGNSGRAPCRWDTRAIPSAKKEGGSEWSQAGSGSNSSQSAGYEWVLGADGKARRVKPGVRLLAHGVPNRVGKLRGFGNAIDPRPAARFIGAYLDT